MWQSTFTFLVPIIPSNNQKLFVICCCSVVEDALCVTFWCLLCWDNRFRRLASTWKIKQDFLEHSLKKKRWRSTQRPSTVFVYDYYVYRIKFVESKSIANLFFLPSPVIYIQALSLEGGWKLRVVRGLGRLLLEERVRGEEGVCVWREYYNTSKLSPLQTPQSKTHTQRELKDNNTEEAKWLLNENSKVGDKFQTDSLLTPRFTV